VPIIPLIVWGAQRIWTKDQPKALGRTKIPVTVSVGAPIPPRGTVDELSHAMREAMTGVLYETQQGYPQPPGAPWLPRRLGCTAPTPAQARLLDEAELAERARRRGES
jgi:1-acyl-sn-glycerol-3-phosphate acyltransferase